MSAVSESIATPAAPPASRAFRWCLEGLRLWRRAPFKLVVLCVAQLLAEIVLQMLPWVGVALSKWVVPVLLMGILCGLDELARERRMRWGCLLDAIRDRRRLSALGLAAAWGFAVFAVQQFSAWLVYGWAAVDAVLLGHAAAHAALMTPAFERVLILPGLLPLALLQLAPCLFLFEGASPWQALRQSVGTALRYRAAFGVLLLLNLAVFALMLATPLALALALLITPWSIACTYAVWNDLRPLSRRPGMAG